MRGLLLFILAVLLVPALIVPAAAAEPQQLYAKEQSIVWDREKVGKDGVGTLFGKYPFNRNTAAKEFIIKEVGWMTLQPGASIGMHKHETNEDAYIILSGEGTFIDSDGKEYKVKAGDTTIARKGQSHALLNTGKEALVFLDIVAER
ncbi:MAG: cupin domain-containing protein [Deltaproteobacteria bacterium]|nr:cupin domain-containing protein [Deltaproteobacteria bacterium]